MTTVTCDSLSRMNDKITLAKRCYCTCARGIYLDGLDSETGWCEHDTFSCTKIDDLQGIHTVSLVSTSAM